MTLPRAALKSPLAPRVPPPSEQRHVTSIRLADGTTYRSLLLSKADLPEAQAANIRFDLMRVVQSTFAETRLDSPKLSDVIFEDCDLSNARWHKATFQRVQLSTARLVGFSLTGESLLQNVCFTACNCRLADFRFVVFKGARFENCVLTEADFQGADLSGVAFVNCDLRSAQLSQARMIGTDLRGSQIDGLIAGAAELRGAIVDPAQTVSIAEGLGMTVAWQDDADPG